MAGSYSRGMEMDRMPKIVIHRSPVGKKRKEPSKKRWCEVVERDLSVTGRKMRGIRRKWRKITALCLH